MGVIQRHHYRDAYTYEEYRQLTKDLTDQGASSGPKQSERRIRFTRLNSKRMDRLDKTLQLLPETLTALKAIREQQFWLVLTETWCGDAAQILPVLNKMAEASPRIQLRMLFRDENTEIMDAYLYHGTRSIPRLIALGSDWKELFNWGPRPAAAQQIMERFKQSGETDKDPVLEEIQQWYNSDKGVSVQREILNLLVPGVGE